MVMTDDTRIHGIDTTYAPDGGVLVSYVYPGAIEICAGLAEEEIAEEFLGTFDGGDAHAAAGPAHHAAAVDAVLGADGEGRESGGSGDGFGGALVERDVAFGHALGVGGADAA